MDLAENLQVAEILIPDTWFYGVISALLGLIIWGINRWVSKLDTKMDKTDTTLNRIEDVLILHGEMFKGFNKRLEDMEAKMNKKPR